MKSRHSVGKRRRNALALAAATVSLILPARLSPAANKFWKSAVPGGNWSTGNNWSATSVSGTDNSGIDFQNDYDGFGAQVFGGVNLNVGPTTGLYGEAVWNASTPKAQFFDPTLGQTVREEVDFDGLGFHGGLRLMF